MNGVSFLSMAVRVLIILLRQAMRANLCDLESVAVLYLSKLLTLFVMPLGLVVVLVFLGGVLALLRRPRGSAISVAIAMTLLLICAMPAVAEWALASLERQYPPRPLEQTIAADVAIVLGGTVGQPMPPRVALDLSSSSDRILHAARLYRAGKVKRVLVTGGNIPWLPGKMPEAELIRELLIEWGVPACHAVDDRRRSCGWEHANHPALAAGCGRTGDDDAGRAGVARLLDLSAAGVYLRRATALSQRPHLT
jgi:DUF218 domain